LAADPIRVDSTAGLTVVDHPTGWFAAAESTTGLAIAALTLAFIARQALSWRRAAGDRRQQLKWLASGATISIVSLVLATALSTPGAAHTLTGLVGSVAWFGVAALPVSIGVAILKYRLYEIDRIISRTLAYAIVTGLLVGVYAGLVLLATEVLRVHTPVAVAAATLAAAALFSPVLRRVQHAVDRRFNRARYNAEQMVTEFAGRLQDAVDPDAVRADLAGVVLTALEPAHVSVWLSGPR
jgi:surface polysaccharide O-acyltransferase-like enzyme